MAARRYKTEIAGVIRVGLEFDSEFELEEFLGRRGIVIVGAPPLVAAESRVVPPESSVIERRGRPSRNEEIAAAIDALDYELDLCNSVKAQARAVHAYLEEHNPSGGPPPGLSTVETFIRCYRKPRASSALKIARQFK